jgi:hypothetical protein
MSLDDFTVATLDGEPLRLGEVLRRAHAEGLRRLIEDSIRERIVERAIARLEIAVHGEELQRARALFLSEHPGWRGERVDATELDEQLRRIIAFGKLKDRVVGDAASSAAEHAALFQSWLDDERMRMRIELTYRELL